MVLLVDSQLCIKGSMAMKKYAVELKNRSLNILDILNISGVNLAEWGLLKEP